MLKTILQIGIWSPPLDEKGNTVRGIEFSEKLVDLYNFHRFDNIRHSERKVDPRKSTHVKKGKGVVSLLFAAKSGDLTALQRYFK